MKSVVANALLTGGLAAAVYGGFLASPWVAWMVGGFVCALIGVAIAAPERKADP